MFHKFPNKIEFHSDRVIPFSILFLILLMTRRINSQSGNLLLYHLSRTCYSLLARKMYARSYGTFLKISYTRYTILQKIISKLRRVNWWNINMDWDFINRKTKKTANKTQEMGKLGDLCENAWLQTLASFSHNFGISNRLQNPLSLFLMFCHLLPK